MILSNTAQRPSGDHCALLLNSPRRVMRRRRMLGSKAGPREVVMARR
jgi:hypothetical protein